MSHSNGKIYVDTTTTPHKGIDIRNDIAYVLGRNTGNLGMLYWDLDRDGNHLANPVVNMWSRHKPVPWSINGVKNRNPQRAHPNDWHKGINGDYGIVIRSLTLVTQLPPLIDGKLNGWSYERDALTTRVRDFRDYYHPSPNPFDYLYIQLDRDEVAPGGALTLQYQLQQGGGSTTDADSLGILDLKMDSGTTSLANYYAAVLIYRLSGGNYTFEGWASAQETIATLESGPAMHSLSFSAPATEGTYAYIPILSKYAKGSDVAPSAFTTIPGSTFSELAVAESVNPSMFVDAFVYNIGTSQNPNYNNRLYFTLNFRGGSNGYSFSNITMDILNGINDVPIHTLTNVQNNGSAGTLTVGADQSTIRPVGSGNYYYIVWPSSAALSLEALVRQYRGKARISPGPGVTVLHSYEQPIREAAGLPDGSAILFGN